MRTYQFVRPATILLLGLMTAALAQAQPGTDPGAAKQQAMQLLRKNLLATGLNQSTLNSYIVSDAYLDKKSGSFLVYLQQAWLDIPVYNKIGVYIFRKDTLVGKKLNFIARLPAKAGPRVIYSVDGIQAIRSAATHLSIQARENPSLIQKDDIHKKFVYTAPGVSRKKINTDLVWLPSNDGEQVKLAWNVRIVTPDGKGDWMVRVDAQTGEVLEKSSLIVSEKASGPHQYGSVNGGYPGTVSTTRQTTPAFQQTTPNIQQTIPPIQGMFAPPPAASDVSYRVFPFPLESPNFGGRTLETDPWLKAGSGNNAATLGWHFDNTNNYAYTRGNNVWALEDTTGDDLTIGFADTSLTAAPILTFDNTVDTAVSALTKTSMHASIDNLFYWNNIMHDVSYQYGFDEASGNFQADNQGRGGAGNDFVHAFSASGMGTDNSNFSTPPDGENPVMRMFLFDVEIAKNFHVNSPSAVAGNYAMVENVISLNTQLAYVGHPVTADIVYVNDLFSSATHQGCPLSTSPSVAGKIAMIDRGGSCNFVAKIKNAQDAGAIAVIIVNNQPGPATGIGGIDDNTLHIPAIMISEDDGTTLKENLTGLNGTMSATGGFRDGALDNGIISHEYTHGISNRLTGGPSNTDCLANAEQGGEGWSDYMALMMTTNWATAAASDGTKPRTLGTYALSELPTGPGVRIHPYSTDMGIDPWTYGDMTGTGGEVHTIGEIWCSALWDMTWNIIQMEGIDADMYHGTKGNNIALQLVIEGMKLQPCSPGFLDARDAILKADSLLYNYAHKCAIWNAFAHRGMGKSALQGSSNSTTDQTPATDLPSGMGVAHSIDKDSVANGDIITYTIKASCDCSPLSNISVVDTLSGNLAFVSAPGGTFLAPAVHFDGLSFAANETKTLTIQAKVTGSFTTPDTLINDTRDPDKFTWTNTVVNFGLGSFTDNTTRSHSPTHSLFAPDIAVSTDFAMVSGTLTLDTISALSFWHFFETDATFDGGVVEISRDNGVTWQDLGPYMIQNGYNSTLDPSSNLPNRPAFSGSSGGTFIQTVIRLAGFAGPAKIRFRFSSDGSIGAEGWYIDDILLKTESGIAGVADAFSGTTLLAKSSAFAPFGTPSIPLPVNFLLFEAQKQDKAAALHWTVNSELSVSKYIVERSSDGQTFSAIGQVPSNPSGAGDKDYYFTDNQTLSGYNYYRIEEVDLDGRSTFSIVKLIDFSNAGSGITVLPVPTYNHMVQLETGTGTDQPVAAYLVNTIGQTLKVYSLKPGVNQLTLDHFPQGVYMLKIVTGQQKTEVRKLVIQ